MIIDYKTKIEYTFKIVRFGKVELYKKIFTYGDVEYGCVLEYIQVITVNERLSDSSFNISVEKIEVLEDKYS